MKIVILVLGILIQQLPAFTQTYHVQTNQHDAFSKSLVELLNAATTHFENREGKFIRYSFMGEHEYYLKTQFPGTAASLLSYRDEWNKNVFLEFRGFATRKELAIGVRSMIGKIKKALGHQLNLPKQDVFPGKDSDYWSVSFGMKDAKGYYSENLHLYTGASVGTYLLSSSKNTKGKKGYYIILKIESERPEYQYYIKPVVSPDENLSSTLRLLINSGTHDFDSIVILNSKLSSGKFRKWDSLHINGLNVFMNYKGSNFKASITFPLRTDTVQQWSCFRQAIEAVVGTDYVYHMGQMDSLPYVLYFRKEYIEQQPRVYLSKEQVSTITIEIISNYSHPLKRSLDQDDLK